MRQITATEKYNAVLEGKMAKKEFVRQMRQAYPMYVSQFNGFDDTVQILKNRQMIFEAQKPAFSGVKVYDDRPALTYSLDALDRGIRIELGTLGLDPALDKVSADDLNKATKKAKDNLEKDANHYLNLMAGESNKVDKHDKEKEVKRGAADKDTFNDMKKATLKEGYTEEQISSAVQRIKERRAGEHEDGTPKSNDEMGDDEREEFYNNLDSVKERLTEKLSNPTLLAAVKQIKEMHPEITSGIVDDFIDMHGQDILDGADPMEEFHNYIDANYEGPSDMREKKGKDHDGDGDIDGDDYMAAKDKAIKKAMGKDESYTMKRIQRAHTQDRLAGRKSTYDIAKEKQKAHQEKQLKEAIKSIIKKSLNQDVINEAATNRLSSAMEDFGGYNGAQSVINSLENIVTEVESFYGKVRDKIQKVYDDMNNIENEEGLKIGPFIGPSIESAFMQDLRPVTKKGFTSGLELPKAKQIDPEMLAQARAAGEVDESPEDPKATVFTPNF